MASKCQYVCDIIIVGTGMCGISCGAGLKQFGIDDFVILEKGNSINNFWKSLTYDRMTLHTPYHDLPYDAGLVYNYPMLKTKHQLTDYLEKYVEKFNIKSNIHLNKEVININQTNDTKKWVITTNNDDIYISNYLCMATSLFCKPKIPNTLSLTMNNFKSKNGIIHSINYKNGKKYKNENVLIVGNGNSAFEIAVDLVSFGANKVTILSRSHRHIINLNDFFKKLRYVPILKKFGILDIVLSFLFSYTPKHPKWDLNKISFISGALDRLSLDLSEYGINKPINSVFEENMKGNLQVLDWPDNESCVKLIKNKRVNYINNEVIKFNENNIIELKNNKMLNEYDSVILCTGYYHGLDLIFDKHLYNKLFEKSKLGKRWGMIPKTNGYNQSMVDKSIYFIGLLGDFSCLGGLSNGYWGWHVARTIAKQKSVYNKDNELSQWNSVTSRRITACIIFVTAIFALLLALFMM